MQFQYNNRRGAGVTDPATGTSQSGSTTAWYLVAPVNQAPVIEVGYLRGQGRRPQLRNFVLDRGQWGIGWDIKMDIGVKAIDFRGIYKANGA